MINISLSIFYFSFYNKIFSDYIPVHFALYISNFDTLRFFKYVFLRKLLLLYVILQFIINIVYVY